MAMGSTQPLTEMSTRNLPGDKGQSVRKTDNLTAICELSVWKMCETRPYTTPWASTACYRNSVYLPSKLFGFSLQSTAIEGNYYYKTHVRKPKCTIPFACVPQSPMYMHKAPKLFLILCSRLSCMIKVIYIQFSKFL
jgi:hypothetical protein